jgi:hypothetical protein
MAQPVEHWAAGWMTGVRFPPRQDIYSLLHNVQTDSDIRPRSYPTAIGGFFLGNKAAGA